MEEARPGWADCGCGGAGASGKEAQRGLCISDSEISGAGTDGRDSVRGDVSSPSAWREGEEEN